MLRGGNMPRLCWTLRVRNRRRRLERLSSGIPTNYEKYMNTQETTRPTSKTRKPQWVRDCQQRLVRFFGGYTKADLKEGCKIAYDMGNDTTGNDMIDLCSWHWDKFGTRYDT